MKNCITGHLRNINNTVGIGILLFVIMISTGCGGSGGGSSTGSYISAGSTILTINGKVVDPNNTPLVDYGVTIDNCPIAVTNQNGEYSANIPVIDISQVNTVQVYDSNNILAYTNTRTIDKSICVQNATDIVIGPPVPPVIP